MAAVLAAAWLTPSATESAVANGDTRIINLSNEHTNESGSFTYMVNGVYDSATLDKLNWFLRDWRLDEPTKMDPRLFDIVWEVYRESGSTQPIDVLSGYRSPQTNAMLRRRSRQVAAHSQHMEGRAIDAHFVDVGTARIRDIAMRMQEGGVGFYPTGATPWVHIDSGSVRYWPRMSREGLARLFPDGKTVFIPSDGQPMPGYDLARAEIEARGGQVQTASGGGFGIFAWLFGARGGADDAEEGEGQETVAAAHGRGGRQPQVQIAEAGPEAVAKAKLNLPTGQTYASAPTPPPAAKPPTAQDSEQQNLASNDSPVQLHGPVAAQFLAPLPPRRPSDLDQTVAALASVPLPPVRPSDLVVAAAPGAPSAAGAQPPESSRGLDLIAELLRRSQLPRVITLGVDSSPTGALALAEVQPSQRYDDNALLARAAELSAPLPPMPIPYVSWPGSTSLEVAAVDRAKSDSEGRPQPRIDSGPRHSAALLGEGLARLFGGMPFDAFKTWGQAASNPNGLRETQQ
jgi:uncharacterized protein YcbK (DUF882 family)